MDSGDETEQGEEKMKGMKWRCTVVTLARQKWGSRWQGEADVKKPIVRG